MPVKLSSIKPNDKNPRTIRDARFERLKTSLEEFPSMMELRPIITDAEGIILGGNMRYRALKALGYKELPDTWVKRADELTEDEKRRFVIADNVGFGDWDWDTLGNEWDSEELAAWGLEVPGWDVGEEIQEAEEDDYEMPDVIHTDIVLGDLFEIGPHRLLCGDSTDSDAVAKLMNEKKADMVFTDPPYDLEDYSWSDSMFLFSNGHQFVLNTSKKNVDISAKHRSDLIRWFAVDFRLAHLVSNNAPMDRVDFIAEFRTSKKSKFTNKYKGFKTLIESVKRSSEKEAHKQAKNPELPGMFIDHYTGIGELVLDLFLGSGTTMVAAHQLNRKCYGMELDPKYCQVIIDRMLKLDPALEVKRNGEAWQPKP
jgi:DNA modification methylase